MSNLIRFKNDNYSIPSGKERTDSPWTDLAIEICKIPPLDTPNQPLLRSKEVGDCVYDTFKQFGKTNK